MMSEGTLSHDFTPRAERMAVHLLLGLVKLGQDVTEASKDLSPKFLPGSAATT
jgi:hypothetical protein